MMQRTRSYLVVAVALALGAALLATTAVAPGAGAQVGTGTVLVNEAVAAGFVTAHPAGTPLPWASNLNLARPDATMANHVTVTVGTGGGVDLYTQNGAHLVADVAGWYVA